MSEYEEKHKLKFPDVIEDDLSEYMSMSRDYIDALSKEDRYSIAIHLAQLSLYIQRLLNRERARLSWCNSWIYSLCAKHWGEYDQYIKLDIRANLLAKENKVVQKIIKIKNTAQLHVDNLDGLSAQIKYLADLLSRSAYGKE